MSVAADIVETYRKPGQVMSRLLSARADEGRALAVLMGACALIFIAQLPGLSRKATLTPEQGQEICAAQEIAPEACDAAREALMASAGATLFAWVFIAPLLFYVLAWIVHLMLRIVTGQKASYGTRLTLFWALLAAAPLFLLQGLVAGLIGSEPQLSIVGALAWLAVLWFWFSGLRVLGRKEGAAA